jgi:nitroreductase
MDSAIRRDAPNAPSISQDDIQEILDSCRADPDLFNTIDVDSLLSALRRNKHDHLDGKTLSDISDEIYDALETLLGSADQEREENKRVMESLCKKLLEYRLADEVHSIHLGKYVKWIRKSNPRKITAGGFVMDIRFTDEGTNILVKCGAANPVFFQYKFDDCITFQRLSAEEQLILLAYEFARNGDGDSVSDESSDACESDESSDACESDG